MSALLRRVVVCLDVDHGRVKKGVRFQSLRDVGCPVELAARYETEGADEIVLLDVSASVEGRATLFDVVRRTAERLFVPLTVGGGVRTVEDFERALRAGADKVGVNSAAVADPELISRASERFGAQCVVLSIDAKKTADFPSGYGVVTHGGRKPAGLDAIAWAKRGVELGAGEILLTSIDRDGVRTGYDVELTRAVVQAVSVPVVASGGAGSPVHVAQVLADAGADAALIAGILHDGETTVQAIKGEVRRAGIAVRA
ncbi:MAG TPA: imidazole glycerol phosphate synthase subunit HisF [Polyangiaceae bacterium]|nr:imidazole glycerol phosphate synthase subunit HisF [Polyangiaceae bacterium]